MSQVLIKSQIQSVLILFMPVELYDIQLTDDLVMLTSSSSYLVGLKPLMHGLEEEHVHLAVLPYSIFSQGLVLVNLVWEPWEERICNKLYSGPSYAFTFLFMT